MCSAGMPELMDREDILYLRDMLCLDLNDRQAEKRFKAALMEALEGTWRRVDNWIHNMRHGGGTSKEPKQKKQEQQQQQQQQAK